MKKRLSNTIFMTVLLFLSLIYTGCGTSGDRKNTNADSTVSNKPKTQGQFRLPPYFKERRNTTGYQAPANNATVRFGIWEGVAGACTNGPGVCAAKAGISASASDSQTVGVSFVTYSTTIGGTPGLSMIICQPNDTNSWINGQLNNYFMAYGGSNNVTGLFSPGVFNCNSAIPIDKTITQQLGLPPAMLSPQTLCGISVANTSQGQEYWTIYFYGLYPGNSGSFQMAPDGSGVDITNIGPYSVGVPNPIFFWTWYENPDKTKVGMYLMFNVNNVIAQNPSLSKFFPVQNGQLGSFQLSFTKAFVFPGDSATVASTGIPAGTVIPAGTTSQFNMSPNNTVVWNSASTSFSSGFSGWVSVIIDSVGYPGPKK